MFKKMLVANRGEIAIRIIRACRELEIPTVAVYSEADRAALHVRMADEAYCIGPPEPNRSYLVIDSILEVARQAGCDAIHPGYGFLSESVELAERCEQEGVTFVGPNPHAIRVMGNKTNARVAVDEMGVPLVPGMKENLASIAQALEMAAEIGYPVVLKAACGVGGKGMRRIDRPEELPDAFTLVRSEALKAFGSDAVYLEKFIVSPRHIEVQILGDRHGNIIHCGERECSIQRRHQKLIEEAPSPFVDPELRRRMGEAAVAAARSVNYDSVGTVEFVVSGVTGEFYFLEMNTRLQVEHPVTEMVVGIDLCKEMIRIAAGHRLTLTQKEVSMSGHAIECRIFAEDPDHNFISTSGRISGLRVPGGPWVRDESGMYEGMEVPIHYDSLLSKLVVWGNSRERCIGRVRRALSEYVVKGIKTTIPFHRRVMRNAHFLSGEFDTTFIETTFPAEDANRARPEEHIALVAAAIKAFRRDRERARGIVGSAGSDRGGNPWRMSLRGTR
ncbi:acetyl-CoA carboxylase biotin carboxylase subunit [Geobacter argillaceus]|uniref:Acetyl-CoA carboxylase biotin carboxylase subunit n=1 Tax=Geobacter argillaceus TaxID=345631 RepID=A0A562VNN5_9BACT|nr:acetyl-CoA carboxylase biotin carboxylase subunit [Geobacter argillaceus]TWJ19347.1 acetyl-CoA carboxylase biotin carboxylase subunit [Geobacter argillaceus]